MNGKPGNGQQAARVWLVDDDSSLSFVLLRALEQAGYRVRSFERLETAMQALETEEPQVLISDIQLPDGRGTALLEWVSQNRPQLPVIMITAYSDLDQAVGAFQGGAFEYLSKPFDLEDLTTAVAKALAQRAGSPAPAEARGSQEGNDIIGDSAAMQQVFRTIGRLSRSDLSVLLTGETGTGKEVIARALHRHSPRADGPFVAINTAAIPEDLLESELFGHERGAFTGAAERRRGRFEEARGGSLFLDEIGDMPLALQTRLLRVLAEGDYYRVGGHDLLHADVRVIAATHQDLAGKVRQGAFREDLFHRLNVIGIHLPPLRERREDIPALAAHFLAQGARSMGLEAKRFHPEAMALLVAADWPGNVRQLDNLCQQLLVMAPGEQIVADDLPAVLRHPAAATGGGDGLAWEQALLDWSRTALAEGRGKLLDEAGAIFHRSLIRAAMAAADGQRIHAAELLGCSRNTLSRRIRELQMDGEFD